MVILLKTRNRQKYNKNIPFKLITLKAFPPDERIYLARTIAEHMKRTEQLRKINKLILCYYKHGCFNHKNIKKICKNSY